MVEHVAQVLQKFALGSTHAHGLLGAAFDREAVHLAYNGVLFAGLVGLAVLLRPGVQEAGIRRPWRPVFYGLLAFQGYHLFEHFLKFEQFLATGRQDTPGFLGTFVPGILLHFAFNAIVLALMLLTYWQWREERSWVRARTRARLRPVGRRGTPG